jgi:hypothetical protein
MPPRPKRSAAAKGRGGSKAVKSAAALQTDNPITRRIGPIFDPAWLKLVKEETLREIAVIQLDGLREMLDVERKAVEQIRSAINKNR